MKLGVFGAGYVGLVTAVCFADKGYDVYVQDIAKEKIATLQSGGIPIFEEGLSQLLQQNKSRLHFIHDSSLVIEECDFLFVCVGTPQDESGKADLFFLKSVVEQIGRKSHTDKTVIIKSTVPPGTTENMEQLARSFASPSVQIMFVHNPEFLRQGKAVYDFMNPERIVIGATCTESLDKVKELYTSWNAPVIGTDSKSAELLKYAANSFLAMKISFINMISQLSDRIGANIDDIAYGIGLDPRIGGDFLKAGLGFGGSCFPKDLKAIEEVGFEAGVRLPLIEDTSAINEEQGQHFFEKIKAYYPNMAGKKMALLGLAFKPFTDDIRCSPVLALAERLLKEGAYLIAYDPLVRKIPIPGIKLVSTFSNALNGSDMAIIVTDWPEFKGLVHAENLMKMNTAIIFDGRNMFTMDEIRKVSVQRPLHYQSVGRPVVSSLNKRRDSRQINKAFY